MASEARVKVKNCVKCELHGKTEEYNHGHKTSCPYKGCLCEGCQEHDLQLLLVSRERIRRRNARQNKEEMDGRNFSGFAYEFQGATVNIKEEPQDYSGSDVDALSAGHDDNLGIVKADYDAQYDYLHNPSSTFTLQTSPALSTNLKKDCPDDSILLSFPTPGRSDEDTEVERSIDQESQKIASEKATIDELLMDSMDDEETSSGNGVGIDNSQVRQVDGNENYVGETFDKDTSELVVNKGNKEAKNNVDVLDNNNENFDQEDANVDNHATTDGTAFVIPVLIGRKCVEKEVAAGTEAKGISEMKSVKTMWDLPPPVPAWRGAPLAGPSRNVYFGPPMRWAVPVSQHLRGVVMGAGGHHIKRIRRMTGTWITWDAKHCIVHGSRKAVTMACKMIHERICRI